jgi:hypothetical protein
MEQIKALYKLGRPLTTMSGVLAVFLGGYVAGTGAWGNIILAGLTTLLVSAAANAWNDYLDVEIDRINQPQRPLPSGKVSLRPPAGSPSFGRPVAGRGQLHQLACLSHCPAFQRHSLCLLAAPEKHRLLGNATVATISA